jgi:hypothetical protein
MPAYDTLQIYTVPGDLRSLDDVEAFLSYFEEVLAGSVRPDTAVRLVAGDHEARKEAHATHG